MPAMDIVAPKLIAYLVNTGVIIVKPLKTSVFIIGIKTNEKFHNFSVFDCFIKLPSNNYSNDIIIGDGVREDASVFNKYLVRNIIPYPPNSYEYYIINSKI